MRWPPTRFSDYLFEYAIVHPDRELAVLGDWRISYREGAEVVRALSRALLESGVRAGDRVAILSTPRPEALLVHLAAIDIGAVTLGITTKYQLEEMRYVIGDSRPRVLFALPEFEGRDYTGDVATLAREYGIETIVGLGEGIDSTPTFEAFAGHGRLLEDGARARASAAVTSRAPALLVYTSGTTGAPKGALITHQGLGWTYSLQSRRWQIDNLRTLCNGPIHHLSGLAELPGTALAAGGTSVFMERFDPGEELALIERERINGMIQIPTQYQLMAAHPDFARADLSSLRRVVWAGAAMPRSVIAAWGERTDAQLEVQYGSTETTLTVTYSDPDADLEQLAESIGKPDPDIELRLADTSGARSAQGEPGEIQVRHPGVFGGYLGRPHATREAFTSDGFLRTGDLAVERPDGSFRLVGRRSEMYKSGGSNVYPREIELCLERHPAVAMAAVVSVPDPLYSEVGHAFVVPVGGTAVSDGDLTRWCAERLANYKRPKRIVVTDGLPMLTNAKIDRRALTAQAREETR
jgi:acyl-CoA synthetase (AMP-forming)/AMP-acid ligase II